MRRLIPLLALIVAACATTNPSPSAAPPIQPQATQVVDTEGPFSLVFELPRTTWRSGEAIEGTVSLRVAEGGPSAIYGSMGGPFMFTYRELTGTRLVEPVADAACGRHEIAPGAPITEPLGKSGAWSDTDPDGPFLKAFIMGPDVRLPAGDWAVSVLATFSDGAMCDGHPYGPTATVVLHIVD